MNESKLLYDAPELQDRIRRLKVQQTELLRQKEALQIEVERKDKNLGQLRQELVVASPNEALRFQADDFGSEDGLDSKRFMVMNEKLEMQLLIHEIHAALPRLEQEAKAAENAARIHTKTVSTNVKALSIGESQALLTKSTAELEQSIEQTMDQLVKIRSDFAASVQDTRQHNLDIQGKISAARRELNRLLQEKLSLQKAVTKIRHKPLLDQQRFKHMIRQQRELRESIQHFHNGYGWQTEAFNSFCGKDGKSVLASKIPSVLEQWLCLDKVSDPMWKTPQFIQKMLRDIRSGGSSLSPRQSPRTAEEEDEEEFLVIAEALSEPAAKSAQAEMITDVDLHTFCQLCDRLVILLER